jgi:phosphoglycolate phosphatase
MTKVKQNNKISTLILDFDGVIADSFGVFIEAVEEVLNRPPLKAKEIENLRGLSTSQIIKELGIKKWQIPKLAAKGRRVVAKKMSRVEPFRGMPEAITEAAKTHELYILSSNDQESIIDFLSRNGLEDKINRIYSGISMFGKAKQLKSLLKHERLSIHDCIYIGDESRDVEAAHSIGMKCIAVEWGYSNPQALKSHKPEATITRPAQLDKFVRSLQKST